MSSDHVYVRNAEWQRIQREAARVQRAEEEARAIQSRAAEREREIARRHEGEMKDLHHRINYMSRQNSEEIRRVSDDFRNRLVQQSDEFSRNMARQKAEFQGDMKALETKMGHEIGRLDVNIRAVDNKVNEMADDFSARFNELSRKETDKKGRAAIHIKELTDLMTAIQGLRSEKFEPGKLGELEQRFRLIQGNMTNGDYEAAIAASQESILHAGRLLSRLMILNELFNERLREVRQRSGEIAGRIESFGQAADNGVQFTLDDEEYTLDYDIAYWSQGEFEEIRRQFAQRAEQVDHAGESLVDLDGLEGLMNNLNHIDAALSECDSFARKELIGSYIVEDTAVRIHNVLAQQGWKHEETGHHNEDNREPYKMIYADGSGNSCAIVVNAGDTPDTPSFMVDVFAESGRGETFRNITKEGLLNRLNAAGIDIAGKEHRDDCKDNPDAKTFIQNKVPEAVKVKEQRRKALTM